MDVVLQDSHNPTVNGFFAGKLAPGVQTFFVCGAREGPLVSISDSTGRDANGRFSFTIPSGEYRVKVMSFSQETGEELLLGFSDFRVNEDDIENLVVPASPIRTVRAKPRWAVDRDVVESNVVVRQPVALPPYRFTLPTAA